LRLCGHLSNYQKGASQRYRNEPPHDSEIHSALLGASPGELRRTLEYTGHPESQRAGDDVWLEK
jgi:hypothetical protein